MAETLTHAGAVAYRPTSAGPELLLVTSSRAKDWVVPKGHIDPGETAAEAALREVREEAGVEGTLAASLGTQEFEAGGARVRVAWWLLRAEREGPSSEGRSKRWCTLDEAVAAVRHEGLRDLLRRAHRAAVEQGGAEP